MINVLYLLAFSDLHLKEKLNYFHPALVKLNKNTVLHTL